MYHFLCNFERKDLSKITLLNRIIVVFCLWCKSRDSRINYLAGEFLKPLWQSNRFSNADSRYQRNRTVGRVGLQRTEFIMCSVHATSELEAIIIRCMKILQLNKELWTPVWLQTSYVALLICFLYNILNKHYWSLRAAQFPFILF